MGSLAFLKDVSSQLDTAFAGIGEHSYHPFPSSGLDLDSALSHKDEEHSPSQPDARFSEKEVCVPSSLPGAWLETLHEDDDRDDQHQDDRGDSPRPVKSDGESRTELGLSLPSPKLYTPPQHDRHPSRTTQSSQPETTAPNPGRQPAPQREHSKPARKPPPLKISKDVKDSRDNSPLSPRLDPRLHQQSSPGSVQAKMGTKVAKSPSELVSPVHPIPALQGQFEESILESMDPPITKHRKGELNAETRRKQLMELEDFSEEDSSRWRQKAGAIFHPLSKLIAQISYGIHLLHTKNAKNEDAVMAILQAHVDEIDSFVEDTIADFDLAIIDINDRIEHLLLPLDHNRTFNRMLCDRPFRESIMQGNEVIEKIITRTKTCMEKALQDVEQGALAIKDLTKYLARLDTERSRQSRELFDVYSAMRGNTQGWLQCFKILETRSLDLEKRMVRLAYIVDEVSKRCGIASRRNTPTGVIAIKAANSSSGDQTRFRSPPRSEKPLPLPPRPGSLAPSAGSRASSQSARPSMMPPDRPSLDSKSSLQTLDSLYRSPEPPVSRKMRPSSASSTPDLPPSRAVHFQEAPIPTSPLARSSGQPSPRLESSRQPVRVSSMSPPPHRSAMHHAPSMSQTDRSTRPNSATRQKLRTSSLTTTAIDVPPVGLGIAAPSSPLWQSNTPTSTAEPEPAANTLRNAHRPPTTRAPASDPTPRAGSTKSSPRTPLSATFSIFPPSASRVNRLAAQPPALSTADQSTDVDSEPSSAGTIRATIPERPDAEATKVLPQLSVYFTGKKQSAELAPRNVGLSLERKSSSSTLSDAPTLSHSHAGSSSLATTDSTLSPRTPEDVSPFDALRSHPVSPDEFPQNRKSFLVSALPKFGGLTSVSMTALPVYASSDERAHDSMARRPGLVKSKTSMSTMRGLFSSKKSGGVRDVRLGSGGLGDLVVST